MIKYFLRGSALQSVSFAVDLIAALILMPFLIRSLGVDGYGIWVIIGTIIGQFALLDLGLASTTQRYIGNALGRGATAEVVRTYSTSIILFWIIGCVTLLGVSAVLPFVPYFFDSYAQITAFRWALFLTGLNAALAFPFSVAAGLLIAKLRVDVFVMARIVGTIVRVVLSFVAVALDYGIVGIALATLAASGVIRAILGVGRYRVAPEVTFSWSSWSRAHAFELVRFGKFILLLRVVDVVQNRLSTLLIAWLLGLPAVTHFAVATRLAEYLQSMILRITTLPGPIFASDAGQGDMAQIRNKYLLVSETCALMCGVTTVSALIFSKRFIELWLGPGFDDSIMALLPLIGSAFLVLLQSPTRDVLGAIYRHPFDAKLSVAEGLASVVLVLLLIKSYGIIGVAIGMAVPATVTKGVILPCYVCTQLGLPIRQYLRAVLPPLAIACAGGAAGFLFLPLDQVHSLLVLIVLGAAFSAVLAAVTFLTLSSRCRIRLCAAIPGLRCRLPWDAR